MKKKRGLTKKQFTAALEDIGYNLHTALRKCCDSSPTSILWNAITVDTEKGIWSSYLAHLRANLIKRYKLIKTEQDLVDVMRILSNGDAENHFPGIDVEKYELSFDKDEYNWYQHKDIIYNQAMIWHSAFELFDEQDWKGYCYYLALSLNLVEDEE